MTLKPFFSLLVAYVLVGALHIHSFILFDKSRIYEAIKHWMRLMFCKRTELKKQH